MIIVYTADVETAVKYASFLGGTSYRGSYVKDDQLSVVGDEVIKEALHYGYVKTHIGSDPAAFVWGKGVIRPLTTGDDNEKLFPFGPSVFYPETVYFAPTPGKENEAEMLSQIFNNKEHHVIYDATASRRDRLDFVSVYSYTKTKTPVRKVEISTSDKESIRRAFSNPLPYETSELDTYKDKTYQYASYLVNANLGRLLQGSFSTPFPKISELSVLSDIILRHDEIEREKEKVLYNVDVEVLLPEGGKVRLKCKEASFKASEDAKSFCEGMPKRLPVRITERTYTERPEGPHSVQSLEKEAAAAYGYSPEETRLILSSLYAGGFITSHITASRNFAAGSEADILKLIKNLEKSKAFGELLAEHPARSISPSCFGKDKKTGILITRKLPDKSFHDASIKNIYYLICKEIVKCVLGDKVYKNVQAEVEIGEYRFTARGRKKVQDGFSVLESKESTSEAFPDALTEGTELPITYIMWKESRQSLQPYKETTFIRQYAENTGTSQDEVKRIIENYILAGYLKRDEGTLLPTEKGTCLVHYLMEKDNLIALAESWSGRFAMLYKEHDPAKAEAFCNAIISEIKEAVLSWHDMFDASGARECSMKCPDCGKNLLKNENGLYCTGCGFKVKRWHCGKNLSDKELECLLKYGSTPLLEGFNDGKKSITGRVYFEDKKPVFSQDSIYRCPACKSHLRAAGGEYFCPTCSFKVSPTLFSYTLKKNEFETLLSTKQSPILSELVDKDGCFFSGVIYLDAADDFKVKCARIV